MPPVGFEPTISAGQRPQTHALNCAATVTDMIYLLTAIGLSPSGSTHLHTNNTENNTNNNRTTQIATNVEERRPFPVFASFALAFALQLREKHGKTPSQGKKNLSQGKKNLSQGKKNLSQGKKNHSQGKKNLSQGKKNLSQGKKNLSQCKKNHSQGKKNRSQGKKNRRQGKKNVSQGKKNLSQGKKNLNQGKKNLSERLKTLLNKVTVTWSLYVCWLLFWWRKVTQLWPKRLIVGVKIDHKHT